MATWKLKALLVLSVLLATLAACSGSSTPSNDKSAQGIDQNYQGPTEQLQPDTPVIGVIQIQESKGKRVIDGYFTQSAGSEPVATTLWQDGERICYGPLDLGKSASSESFEPVLNSGVFVGKSIDIQSRTGNYISLQPQYLGNSVSYASDARWVSTQLPADALLSVSGSQSFPEMSGIALSPLQPIKRLAPASGILPPGEYDISWEAGNLTDDKVQLVLTSPYENSSTSGSASTRLDRVYCNLPDNGSFTVPTGILNALGQPDTLFVSLSRRRVSVFSQEENELRVSQVSFD